MEINEKMITHSRKRALALALCLAGLCFLSGCFDYEIALGLKKDGKTTLDVSLTLPQRLAQEQKARRLGTIVRPMPALSRKIQGNNLILREKVDLDYLDNLAARRVFFEVDTIDTGILGMGGYTYRLVAKLSPSDGDLPERTVLPGTELEKRKPQATPAGPATARARRLLSATLGRHHVTMTFVVPGKVVKSWPLVLGGSRIDPKIADKGSRISWQVPLAVLINEKHPPYSDFPRGLQGGSGVQASGPKEHEKPLRHGGGRKFGGQGLARRAKAG